MEATKDYSEKLDLTQDASLSIPTYSIIILSWMFNVVGALLNILHLGFMWISFACSNFSPFGDIDIVKPPLG